MDARPVGVPAVRDQTTEVVADRPTIDQGRAVQAMDPDVPTTSPRADRPTDRPPADHTNRPTSAPIARPQIGRAMTIRGTTNRVTTARHPTDRATTNRVTIARATTGRATTNRVTIGLGTTGPGTIGHGMTDRGKIARATTKPGTTGLGAIRNDVTAHVRTDPLGLAPTARTAHGPTATGRDDHLSMRGGRTRRARHMPRPQIRGTSRPSIATHWWGKGRSSSQVEGRSKRHLPRVGMP